MEAAPTLTDVREEMRDVVLERIEMESAEINLGAAEPMRFFPRRGMRCVGAGSANPSTSEWWIWNWRMTPATQFVAWRR
jgi:hypothetical protein